MVFVVDIADAKDQFPQFDFIKALTPSVQKAAFHVRDKSGADLCLKLVSPDYAAERLQREIGAMQKITHPNVVSLKEYTYSSTAQGSKHYLIEDFIAGHDLTEELGVPWERSRVAKVFSQLMDGLEQLNVNGIVHRDLKPSNIRLRTDDSPVIIDFGLSRHLNLADITVTNAGAQIGTPSYFAPEQFDGTKRDIDHRTDLFAAGIIIFQALTGLHPFYAAGMSMAELQRRVTSTDDFKREKEFSSLPGKWKLIVERLLLKDRVSRASSALQVAQILHKLKDE